MPPEDSSSSPFRSCAAPVNAPLACPNSSDSNSSSPSTAQLTGTNTARPRGPSSWIARAVSSLPVPDSPSITTGNGAAATRGIFAFSSRIGPLSPTSRATPRGPPASRPDDDG